MRPMSVSEFRSNLARALDMVTDDLEEVVITRTGHEPAVVISLREYESLKETAYLLGTSANARHLEESIAQLRRGEVESRELLEPDGEGG
ncbi:type II toxin-antitoxin system prevent-host-death family antitoxin [Nocardia sp. NPDC051030]|uniref:type II toxin-antitoxin system Phd/YefM family antitoxin n=1 Tax=Nocardia sp. NPDC051030 TaxID=3155162 RepID=UPI003447E4CD